MFIIVAFNLLLIYCKVHYKVVHQNPDLTLDIKWQPNFVPMALPYFWFLWEVFKWPLFIRAMWVSSIFYGIYIAYALSCVMERVCMAQPTPGGSPGAFCFSGLQSSKTDHTSFWSAHRPACLSEAMQHSETMLKLLCCVVSVSFYSYTQQMLESKFTFVCLQTLFL